MIAIKDKPDATNSNAARTRNQSSYSALTSLKNFLSALSYVEQEEEEKHVIANQGLTTEEKKKDGFRQA